MRLGPRGLLVLGFMLGALGWWLPWVLHQQGAAGLVLLGLDLGEFWKFSPEWRAGQLVWERHAFFLPPTLAAIGLALALAGGRGGWRWLLLPPLLALALVALPEWERLRPAVEYGNPLAYESAHLESPAREIVASWAREFTFQLRLVAASVGAVLLAPLWARLGPRLRAMGSVALALAGATLPAWALWRCWLLLQGLYGGKATAGLGVGCTVAGFALAGLGGAWALWQALHAPPAHG